MAAPILCPCPFDVNESSRFTNIIQQWATDIEQASAGDPNIPPEPRGANSEILSNNIYDHPVFMLGDPNYKRRGAARKATATPKVGASWPEYVHHHQWSGLPTSHLFGPHPTPLSTQHTASTSSVNLNPTATEFRPGQVQQTPLATTTLPVPFRDLVRMGYNIAATTLVSPPPQQQQQPPSREPLNTDLNTFHGIDHQQLTATVNHFRARTSSPIIPDFLREEHHSYDFSAEFSPMRAGGPDLCGLPAKTLNLTDDNEVHDLLRHHFRRFRYTCERILDYFGMSHFQDIYPCLRQSVNEPHLPPVTTIIIIVDFDTPMPKMANALKDLIYYFRRLLGFPDVSIEIMDSFFGGMYTRSSTFASQSKISHWVSVPAPSENRSGGTPLNVNHENDPVQTRPFHATPGHPPSDISTWNNVGSDISHFTLPSPVIPVPQDDMGRWD